MRWRRDSAPALLADGVRAVDRDELTRDVRRAFTGEEHDGVGHLVGGARPTDGCGGAQPPLVGGGGCGVDPPGSRSEEHTSELQSLMRISYAVFCLKTKKQRHYDKS